MPFDLDAQLFVPTKTRKINVRDNGPNPIVQPKKKPTSNARARQVGTEVSKWHYNDSVAGLYRGRDLLYLDGCLAHDLSAI